MKKMSYTIAFLLLMSVQTFAQTPPPQPMPPMELPQVSLSASLTVSSCEIADDVVTPCHALFVYPLPRVNITLFTVCSNDGFGPPVKFPPSQPPPYGGGSFNCSHNEFRGHYSTVTEVDGVRYIGLVTITAYSGIRGPDNKVEILNYNFNVEIIGAKGTEAKMSMNVEDPSKLNTTTLVGREKAVGRMVYEPQFTVGPVHDSCLPNPVDPGAPTDPILDPCAEKSQSSKDSKLKSNRSWQVTQGHLR